MKLYIRAHDLGVKDIDPIAEKLVEYGLDAVQFVAYKALSDVKQSVGSFTSGHAIKVAKSLKNVNKTIHALQDHIAKAISDMTDVKTTSVNIKVAGVDF